MKFACLAWSLSGLSYLALAAPAEARFLQVDPIGYQDQINLYAYVGNDPANASDPSGEACVMTSGGAKCTWDAVNGDISGRDSRRALGNMESVLDKAASNPSGSIEVGGTDDLGNVLTVTMNGADFVKDATNRRIEYGGSAPLQAIDPNAYRALSHTDPRTGEVKSTFYDRSIVGRSDEQIQSTAAHEFAHQGAAEAKLRENLNRGNNGIGEHQDKYKDNLEEIERNRR